MSDGDGDKPRKKKSWKAEIRYRSSDDENSPRHKPHGRDPPDRGSELRKDTLPHVPGSKWWDGLKEDREPPKAAPGREMKDQVWLADEDMSAEDILIRGEEQECRALLAKGETIPFTTSVLLGPGTNLDCGTVGLDLKYVSANHGRLRYPVPDCVEAETRAPFVETLQDFTEQWRAFAMGVDLFANLPVVAAGGSVLAALHFYPRVVVPKRVIQTNKSSVEIFVEQFNVKKHAVGKHCVDDPDELVDITSGELQQFYEFAVWHNENVLLPTKYNVMGKWLPWATIEKDDIRVIKEQFVHCATSFQAYQRFISNPGLSGQISNHVVGLLAFISARCWYSEETIALGGEGYSRYAVRMYAEGSSALREDSEDPPKLGCGIQLSGVVIPSLIKYLPPPVVKICESYLETDTAAVLSYYHPWGRALRSFRTTDIDLFLVTRDADEAKDAIREIYRRLCVASDSKVRVMRTAHATTFIPPPPFRKVQVVHRLYHSVAQVLLGFDIDCCALAYDGKTVVATNRGRRALETRRNIVDVTRQSTTYEARLFKYARRGFDVVMEAEGIHRWSAATEMADALAPLHWRRKKCKCRNGLCLGCVRAVRQGVERGVLTPPQPVGVDRLLCMFYRACRRMAADLPCGASRFARALGVTDSVSDYDRAVVPDSDHKNFVPTHVIGTDLEKILHSNVDIRGRTAEIPRAIEFQTYMPHIQGRETMLATGSFQPLAHNWYNGSKY